MNFISENRLARDVAQQLGSPVRLKTWSLIVTVFGDAIQPRGGSVAASTLGEIMKAMGVEAGAMRTAISRLAKDGWVERRRDGRTSTYRLAGQREREFSLAADRIYAGGQTGSTGSKWALVFCGGEKSEGEPAGTIRLSRNWLLADLNRKDAGSREAGDIETCFGDAMVYRGEFLQMPGWFQKLLAPQEEADAMHHLIGVFAPIAGKLQGGWQPEPLEALVLRCLLIHGWRRIALRLKGLPEELLPDDWPEAQCRALVGTLYKQLVVPSEAWLDEAGLHPGDRARGMPEEIMARFT
ncbi:PaaX family transcriptional regulator C-terminal domain-containing protein [Salaquimonas pukyongi]|uniref:PaaX family transcriptional regulator C-terminal domain-containing protein n=1 Tax=Salaquimonas pukyongi TaxID=2712698 RepID=UPI00096BC06D|nr:PaaX family transcriptional regulator C-terminal domain-containing protein [Salaquimonas pukyongi]